MGEQVRELPFDPMAYKAGFEPEEIRLDDVEVAGVGGIKRTPWAGESVWVEPFLDPDDEFGLLAARDALVSGQSEGDIDAAFAALCDLLGRIVLAWNITDKHNEPLPPPHRNPDAFKAMPTALMFALVSRIMTTPDGGTDGPKGGNASAPSSPAKRARRSR